MKKTITLVGFILLVVLSPMFTHRNADAFDDKAHKALSERATTVSSLDNFLKTVLGFEFPDGINQPGLAGNTVTQRVQEGATLEDSLAKQRVRHHFHNPKLSWDQAGLRPPGSSIPIGQSFVVWSQNINQGDGGKASWHQAREAYFQALTETEPFARKVRWAETFRLLGHAIHHVQDAAAPSHTRNDSHLPVVNSDRFHAFAERPEILALITTIAASPPDASFLSNQASSDSRYPVPISRLLDVNAGDIGGLALGNGEGLGIAEYSNANFFSDDSIFPETFTYPGLANLQLSTPELDPTTGKKKTYLIFKPGFGDGTNYRLAQASSLRNITGTNVPTDIGLDYKVFTDYAHKLFPRAIGYSAGLIDYFFRNGLVGGAGDMGCFFPPFPTQFPYDTFGLWVGNNPTESIISGVPVPTQEAGPGRIVAVVHYSHAGQSHYFTLLDTVATLEAESGAGWVLSSVPMGQVPADATDLYIIFAYRGPLGLEDDAVIGGFGYFFGLC